MHPYRFTLSLRLTHPKYSAEEIEEKLKMNGRVTRSAGDLRKTPKGNLLDGVNKVTYCTFQLIEGDDSQLEDAFDNWNRRLFRYKEFLSGFIETGGTLEYFLGLFLNANSGFVLLKSQMRAMNELGIDLACDIYPYS
jgi:hypothetical protein